MIDIDEFAEGPEPAFLGSATVDQLAAMVLTLGMELSVLAARVAELEDRDPATDSQSASSLLTRLFANLRPSSGHSRPLVAERLDLAPRA
ncbi:MAG: hypothetical protein J0I34_25125 [Pseudonocardia sp.]|uniref:hypothetical protein n=1 Tax=unclassified Pseudonocardia TaxID=2619320 RepID=UPI000869CAB5|nr:MULTISPECIES: hypothetical protein [unclassified Pseudonocardia]MBN9112054.1 hypothetical protein [Pseudonocardia sp.]ODU26182.1 MAG: hypothetical protein ABS80_07805 [Pseudonocardia sp. SCN 72-51]ODV06025.1 MAG: hypothetical protein ABT15_14520 [Pseudonocardia sp. SCN 73-27]